MKMIIHVYKSTNKIKSAERIFCKISKKSIYVCISHSDTNKKENNLNLTKEVFSLYAAPLWTTADVWDLICKGLGHPLSVWELAFSYL